MPSLTPGARLFLEISEGGNVYLGAEICGTIYAHISDILDALFK